MQFLKDNERADNPYKHSNIVSRYFFSYVSSVIRTGNKRSLEKTDVLKNRAEDDSEIITGRLERCWTRQLNKTRPSFFRAIASFVALKYFRNLLVFILLEATRLIQPIFLKWLLDVVAKEDLSKNKDAYIWAGALVASVFGQWLFIHPVFYWQEVLGAHCRSGALGVIFKKILRISQPRLAAVSNGHVVTLFSSDAHKIQEGLKLSPYIIIAPIEVGVAIYLLWMEVGYSCMAGVGVMILILLLQSCFGKVYACMRVKVVKRTDERVAVTSEVMSSMKITKIYAWEDSFKLLVKKLRKSESGRIMTAALMRGLSSSMYGNNSYMVLFATFVTYYFYGDGITMGKVYFAMSLFFVIRMALVLFFPLALQMMTEFHGSCKRIEKFLLQDEVPKKISNSEANNSENPHVIFNAVSASWEGESLIPLVNNISFKADRENSLVIIHGPSGSGKTSVLMAAMNEMPIKKGNVSISGTVSYVSQEPWIFSGSIRQNILFGKDFDKNKFEDVIDACSLREDINLFDHGEYTFVGERGVSLSDSQKARINLARAVYADSNIYYLDDPFNCMEPKFGRKLFQQCIKTHLKNKIVLFTTHQEQYLDETSQVVSLNKVMATYSESDLCSSLSKESDLSSSASKDSGYNVEKEGKKADVIELSHTNHKIVLLNDKQKVVVEDFPEEVASTSSDTSCTDDKKGLLATDHHHHHDPKPEGRIVFKTYLNYFVKGVGILEAMFFVFIMVLGQACLTFIDYWIGEWSQGETDRRRNETIETKVIFKMNPDYNIYLFAGLLAAGVFLNTFRGMYLYNVLVKCSRNLHNRMFNAVLRAPLSFFDTTPTGQIMNRFSRDIHLMDDELPWIFSDFATLLLLTMAVVTITCLDVPHLMVVAMLLAVGFIYLRRYYLNASRELRRLEAAARTPLYTHISSTITGISTIRSFGLQEQINKEFHRCLNYQSEAWILLTTASRWFAQRLDLIVLMYVACAAFAPIVIAPYVSKQDRGLIGLSLAYLLNLCGVLQWCVKQSTEVDNMMASVERVIEYSEISPETDIKKGVELPEGWPTAGKIKAREVSFAYGEKMPDVLKKLNFNIRSKEKIGIVGRTGAGKSSIISMLFRLGPTKGTLKIDGVNINQLKLKDLRNAMSYIPQDPVLFCGTLRKNLDPFQKYTDEAIWNALQEVQLKKKVQLFKSKLETEISKSACNLSVGEKQLLCLARALLKGNKILMIDEATMNVDHSTDLLIQKTIREKFRDCTVLTVAHRLNTVMESDRILVMHDGRIAEFDAPHILLGNRYGLLRKLVDQNGPTNASKLKQLAKEYYFTES